MHVKINFALFEVKAMLSLVGNTEKEHGRCHGTNKATGAIPSPY
jgi:hypothetical protein